MNNELINFSLDFQPAVLYNKWRLMIQEGLITATEAQIPLPRRSLVRSRVANHRKTRKSTGKINQNNLFMQNKAKSLDEQINVTAALTAGYENICLPGHPQNKPKQSQNKPKSPNAQINVTAALKAGYENIRLPRRMQNKPKQSQNKPKSSPNKPNLSAIALCDGGTNPISNPPGPAFSAMVDLA